MFDDNQPQTQGQVPGNLPIGEPEDIFEGTDDTLNQAPPSDPAQMAPPSAAPMPSTALGAGVLKPIIPNAGLEAGRPPSGDNFMSGGGMASAPAPTNTSSRSVFTDTVPVSPLPDRFNQATPPAYNMGAQMPTASDAGAQQVGPQGADMYSIKEPIGNKKTIVWIIVIVIVVILGAGSAWIYFSFIRNADTTDGFGASNTFTNLDTAGQLTDIESDSNFEPTDIQPVGSADSQTNTNGSGTGELNVDQNILFGEPIDTDGDGLYDVREADLGTDPLNWDTDSDELSDSDEVTVWKTDPLNPDTDGDNYSDGAEIRNGYSPTGSGKLFDLPTEESS